MTRTRAPRIEETPRLAVAMDRSRVLLLRAAQHADGTVALAAWDTLVRDAGGPLG
jgi:hypothetical protein